MTTTVRGMRARGAALAVTALLATLPLSSCGLFGGSGSDSGSTDGDGPPVKLNDDGSVPQPLTTLTRQIGDYDITIDVAQIRRVGKITRAQFTINPRSRGTSSKLSASFLAKDYGRDVSGTYLLDTAHLKRYTVLLAPKDACVCSSDLSEFPLDTPTLLFADFPSLPQDVSRISLVIPQLGPLPAVEVS